MREDLRGARTAAGVAAVDGRRRQSGDAGIVPVVSNFSTIASLKLRPFFVDHFAPTMENSKGRAVEKYHRLLQYWEALTDDPPLGEIDGNDKLVSDFKMSLLEATYCRVGYWQKRRQSELPEPQRSWTASVDAVNCGCLHDKPLSSNTVIAQLDHLRFVLNYAGPRHGGRPDALRVIDVVPYTKPPRHVQRYRSEVTFDELDQLYLATEFARAPAGSGWDAPAVYRAFLAMIRCTSLRFSQLERLRWENIDFKARLAVLPAEICRKSKRDEAKPLSDQVIATLMPLRGTGARVFPFYQHAKTSIYDELHRLQKLAGLSSFGFHDIRRAVLTEMSEVAPAAAQLAGGHASYTTTQVYQYAMRLLKKAVDQQRPLGASG